MKNILETLKTNSTPIFLGFFILLFVANNCQNNKINTILKEKRTTDTVLFKIQERISDVQDTLSKKASSEEVRGLAKKEQGNIKIYLKNTK